MIRKFFSLALLFVAVSASAQVRVTVASPNIDPSLPFEIGVTIQNGSGAGLKNLTAIVTIPAGVQVTAIPSTCSQSGQTLTCLIADLPFILTLPPKTFGLTAIADDSTNGTVLPISVDLRAEDGHPITSQTLDAKVYRTIFVTQTTPDALGAAIDQANAACNDDYPCKIAFRLGTPPEPGYYTLTPAKRIPKITAKNISIDGTTQTRLTGDTNANGPEVYIDGSQNEWEDALVFEAPSDLELAGVAIGNFRNAAVTLNGKMELFSFDLLRSVHNNFLGVDPSGTQAAPNGRGIVFDEQVALGTSVTNNVISGNRRSGIWMGRAAWNRIAENTIGLDIHHQPLGNGASGIYVGPRAEQVDIRGNYIAFNHDFGVAVDRKAIGTDIGPNSIFANAQIGIDIGLDGPTPNQDIPAPNVLSAVYDAGHDKTVVTVSLSDPPTGINPVLTIYASDAPHRSGYGDGQYLLGTFISGSRTITFAANGDWRGKWVSATVTSTWTIFPKTANRATPDWEYADSVSTTSEFSRAVQVQ